MLINYSTKLLTMPQSVAILAAVSGRPSKNQIYVQFARVGQALASGKRLEVLDLLGQAPRHVEALAVEMKMSVPSVSQHLGVLRHAGLVESERQGTKMVYRLTDESVLRLWLALRTVAESRLAELTVLYSILKGERSREGVVGFGEMSSLLEEGAWCLIDVRPLIEYGSGHIPGAISMPVDELPSRMEELTRDRPVIAYSRGKYCLLADKAAAVLRLRGFQASRLKEGWTEWKLEARPVLETAAG